MNKIEKITGLEILDSRGNPTVKAIVELSDGSVGEASVPSGASTGSHEAHELRDADEKRYRGKGVLKAVEHIDTEIASALRGLDAEKQTDADQRMRELDGTGNKSRLGANAILGVSLAIARAGANAANLPLYRYLNKISGGTQNLKLPVPMMNVVNGGKHADSGLDIQEFMIIPDASTFSERLRKGVEVFHALGGILKKLGNSTAVGDEGGYAPRIERNDEVFSLLTEATEVAGYETRKDITFAIDAAASEFYNAKEEVYVLNAPQIKLPRERLSALYAEWVQNYPLHSIEDPLFEDDWEGWSALTEKFGAQNSSAADKVQIVGDDFFVTNIERLRKGISSKAANAILIKVNQIGTLTETLSAIRLAQENNYGVIISHRSGETADTFIADLAVATGAGQIKTGSLSRSERVEKYNRLLAIERELLN